MVFFYIWHTYRKSESIPFFKKSVKKLIIRIFPTAFIRQKSVGEVKYYCSHEHKALVAKTSWSSKVIGASLTVPEYQCIFAMFVNIVFLPDCTKGGLCIWLACIYIHMCTYICLTICSSSILNSLTDFAELYDRFKVTLWASENFLFHGLCKGFGGMKDIRRLRYLKRFLRILCGISRCIRFIPIMNAKMCE